MSQINPFTGSILQAPHVQRQQSVEKDRQVRQAADTAKNSALTEDQLDHQVESAEELTPIHKDGEHDRGYKRRQGERHDQASSDDAKDPKHLDLTA